MLQGYAQFFGIELCAAFGSIVFDNQLYKFPADFLFSTFNSVLGLRTVTVQLIDPIEKHVQHTLRHSCFGHIRSGGDACQQ